MAAGSGDDGNVRQLTDNVHSRACRWALRTQRRVSAIPGKLGRRGYALPCRQPRRTSSSPQQAHASGDLASCHARPHTRQPPRNRHSGRCRPAAALARQWCSAGLLASGKTWCQSDARRGSQNPELDSSGWHREYDLRTGTAPPYFTRVAGVAVSVSGKCSGPRVRYVCPRVPC